MTEGGVVAGQRWPQWSADGTQIVFYAGRAGRAQMRNELMEDAARLYLVRRWAACRGSFRLGNASTGLLPLVVSQAAGHRLLG